MGIQDFVSGAILEAPESLVSVSVTGSKASIYRNNFNSTVKKLLLCHPKLKDSDDVVLNAAISTHFGHGRVVQPMTSPQSMSKLGYIYMRAAVQQWLQLKESVPNIKQKVDIGATLTLDFQLSQRFQERSADDAWDFVFPQHTFQNLTLQTNEQPLNSKVLNVRPLVVALDGTSFNFKHTHGYKGAHMSGVMPSQRVPQLDAIPSKWSNNNQYEALFLPLFKHDVAGSVETQSDDGKDESVETRSSEAESENGGMNSDRAKVEKQPRRVIKTATFQLTKDRLSRMPSKRIKEEQEVLLKQAFENRRTLADDAPKEQIDIADMTAAQADMILERKMMTLNGKDHQQYFLNTYVAHGTVQDEQERILLKAYVDLATLAFDTVRVQLFLAPSISSTSCMLPH
ncbi:hypothetical protein BCR33DRAFT_278699 [Rhizoclosmatium globosum]|uniref:Uncharacterized protein n=1 Tax=Rhizoclosmatium globosum TaxID=329046 RepID=A0A1Y2C6T0_9FUNG|nr:hypothetical protein BCR33DRAFT_278699 [Rhizoclosmatium globosum]|eukprot:ORY42742.1 hypothetical protein BCR33DRAFT_278699 [Rhizoclosmatium globosum]